ncbi:MAG: hypothetical protein WBP13_10785 [Methylophilaceae bacterium]
MNTIQKALLASVGAAFALSVATPIMAGENPFALKTLSSGYQVADNGDTKMKDGKCGAGKCGADKKKHKKMKDGSCHHDKAKEGSCSADKMKEGSCSADKMKDSSAADMKDGAADKMKEGSSATETK